MPTITLLKPYEKQQEIISALKQYRYVVASLARRTGKTIIGMNATIEYVLETQQPALWCSISYKQLSSTFDMFVESIGNITTSINRQQNQIKLINGGRIDFFSLDKGSADSIRGKKFGFCVIDEAAFTPALSHIYYNVIAPALIDYQGKTLFISSPNGYNDFYQFFQNQEKSNDWFSITATTYDNPFIPRAEIDRLKEVLPEKTFRTEILGQFLESSGSVFSNVSQVVRHRELPTSSYCTIGVDLARSIDNSVFIVIRDRHIIEIVIIKDKTFSLQTMTIKALAKKHKPDQIIIERNGLSMQMVEELAENDLPITPFNTTHASKKIIVETLIVGVEQGIISVEPDIENVETLLAELTTFESKQSSTGAILYAAPKGLHDDCVIACALAFKPQYEMFLYS